jgi:predicted NACHT family NTPase
MDRGIQATAAGLGKSKEALKRKGWTQEYLAGVAGCTRQTISKFLAGQRIEQRIFQDICNALDLRWGDIAELDAESNLTNKTNLDAFIQELRQKVSANIQKRCGTMRVLDMDQPITIDSIYTSVNILEKISRNQRLSIEELWNGCDRENFDRFILGAVKQKRIPGLEAVKKHDKLLILGKPGAGKTTFLKWLGLQCIAGQLHQERIPFFVTLKEFSEVDGNPSLIDFLATQLNEFGIPHGRSIVEEILQEGRSLILLDGLDEVRVSEHYRVINTIDQTSEQFNRNQFVMTCRIAAKEYTFVHFTEVEVADFDIAQITDFAYKWFHNKDPIKAKEFPGELKSYPGLQELATNPLLLTLLCLVFEERAGFPANRSELYEEGLDVLLKKWDVKRNIKREDVYKQLSLKRKEDLLSQIAYTTFQRGDYFFKQKFVEEVIQDYIRNLPNVSNEPKILQLDSEDILKSIEAQHGLLVERSRGIYSFSHLTFHEYFTARQFKEKSDSCFSDLVINIHNIQWREVFLLTVGMLKNADLLLLAMKQKIDLIFNCNEEFQKLLAWVEKTSLSTKDNYKPAAIRAYYFNLALDCNLNLDLDLRIDNSRASHHALVHACANDLNRALDLVFNFARTHAGDLSRARVYDYDKEPEKYQAQERKLNFTRNLASSLASALNITNNFARVRTVESIELLGLLQYIKNKLPNISAESLSDFSHWWEVNGRSWMSELEELEILHRNISHNWKFNKAQRTLFQQYYDANKLLIDCLNSDCYVSREVREEIESTLLLPIASIEKIRSQ